MSGTVRKPGELQNIGRKAVKQHFSAVEREQGTKGQHIGKQKCNHHN